MKAKVFLLTAVAALSFLSACDDDDNGKLDPNANLYINGVDKTNKAATSNARYTAAEICRMDSLFLLCYRENIGMITFDVIQPSTPHVDNPQVLIIDSVNTRIAMRAANITALDGVWGKNPFLDSESDVYLMKGLWERGMYQAIGDTLAYVPRDQRAAVYDTLSVLFAKEDWNTVYKVFQEAMTFVPCTGEEYKALQDAGLE